MKSFTFGLATVELVLVALAIHNSVKQNANTTEEASACGAESWRAAAHGSLSCDDPATAVTVSDDRRVFVGFPVRNPTLDGAVAEIGPDGAVRPYPSREWNAWGPEVSLNPARHFVCVQSLVCEGDGLWALDSGRLKDDEVSGAAKLVRIDLNTDRVDRVYAFRDDVAWQGSKFNDVRIDADRNVAYITDAGTGGMVVLDLATGRAHRLPDGDAGATADLISDPAVRVPHGN